MMRYSLAGLAVAADIALPGGMRRTGNGPSDVTIRRASVADDLDGATARGEDWAMKDGTFLLRVPDVARFLIRHGREIAYDIDGGADARDGVIFLIGSAFGILLHQRGHFVLHASAVEGGGGAALLCGPSGAGKSTLAAALLGAGYSFVTDDVCLVELGEEGGPRALPDGRMLKLWEDALDYLSLAERKGEAVRNGIRKFYVRGARPRRARAG